MPQCHVCYLLLWKIVPRAWSKIWPNHLQDGGGGLEPLPHTLVLSSSVELWVLGAVSDFPKLAPPMDPHR